MYWLTQKKARSNRGEFNCNAAGLGMKSPLQKANTDRLRDVMHCRWPDLFGRNNAIAFAYGVNLSAGKS